MDLDPGSSGRIKGASELHKYKYRSGWRTSGHAWCGGIFLDEGEQRSY